jgi:hypothetical protein
MQHVPLQSVTSRAIRSKICTQCYQRPAGSEAWEPHFARPCESECAILRNLPKLEQIAAQVNDPGLDAYEAAVRQLVCQRCTLSATAGDFCVEHATRTCPLSRYLGDVIEVLGRVPKAMAR